MLKENLILATTLLVITTPLIAETNKPSENSHPNGILILSDDQGHGDFCLKKNESKSTTNTRFI